MLKMRANSLTIRNSPKRTARTITSGRIPTRAGAIARRLHIRTKAGFMPSIYLMTRKRFTNKSLAPIIPMEARSVIDAGIHISRKNDANLP